MNYPVIEGLVQPGWHGALPSLDFTLPPNLEAGLPPEARGLHRDQVRLMVSYRHNLAIDHSRFDHLVDFLHAGDVLVINTSKTLKAALKIQRADGTELELHLSTHLSAHRWVVEARQAAGEGTAPFDCLHAGEKLRLPAGGEAIILSPYPEAMPRQRLWTASLILPQPVESYLETYGFPIRYKYVHQGWPVEYYQNVYANEPGSAEMPSAGRAFSAKLIISLVAQGVLFAPLVLHTGVASLENDEPPYEEYFRVPETTAGLINSVHAANGRVIAVGTTAVRALQTVSNPDGSIHAGEGWTDLVITPDTYLASIDGLLTGFHEPRSSHLSMLLAVAGNELVTKAYREALENGYLWHEFGDVHLILP